MPRLLDIRLGIKFMLRRYHLQRFLNDTQVPKYQAEAIEITTEMHKFIIGTELGTMLSPLRGPIVYAAVRSRKPSVIIETGVGQGSSSRYILEAVKRNGKGELYSVDLPNADPRASIPDGKETVWLVPSSLRSKWAPATW